MWLNSVSITLALSLLYYSMVRGRGGMRRGLAGLLGTDAQFDARPTGVQECAQYWLSA